MNVPDRKDRRKRTLLIIGAIFVLIIFLTVLQTYLQGSGITLPVGSNILVFALVNINIILIMVLVLLVLRNLIKLYFERKRKVIGAKFRTRLVVAFVALSIVPALILFLVSLKLITSSIQRWFDIQLEEALRSSSEIANLYYQDTEQSVDHSARLLAEEISERSLFESYNRDQLDIFLRRKLEEHQLAAVEIYSRPGRADLLAVNPALPLVSVDAVKREHLRSAFDGVPGTEIEAAPDWDLFRTAWPVRDGPEDAIRAVVVVNHVVPDSRRGKMSAATRTFEEYQQLKLFRLPIQASYKMTLVMIALLITFAATWFAFYLARSITTPIQELAEGTRRIAGGNLDVEITTQASDEIGLLISSFNKMTRDLRTNKVALDTAYTSLQKTNRELEERRNVIETILENIFTGVLSMDPDGTVNTLNHAAEKMLGIQSRESVDRHFREVFDGPALQPVAESLEQVLLAEGGSWEGKVSLTHGSTTRTLVVSAVGLRDQVGTDLGQLVVFEDLTHLIKAQRTAAWREVARRIAHEIKNPLTPIQLSIQRARKKYLSRSPDYDQVFLEATETITSQVDELKKLVDEFSRFARLPSISPAPVDIHEIIEDSLKLYRSHRRGIDFPIAYHPSPLIINGDAEQLKRVLINLIENSLDAIEGEGKISFETSVDQSEGTVRVRVSDDGRGLPEKDRDKLFLPYYSTKKGGTGLGLAIVSDIVNEHKGEIRVEDNEPKGTVFILEFPLCGETTEILSGADRSHGV
jgi:two-component system nitrogen regulation sensor histidine kinase NtrY